MKSKLLQLCLIAYILPKAPVKAPRLKLHISYFLQKCKKAKFKYEICLSDIRKHNLTVFNQKEDILQGS